MARYIDADALTLCVEKKFNAHYEKSGHQYFHDFFRCVNRIIRKAPTIEARPVARPLEEWHEDYGDVLWWKFPIEEPPYVGSPLDCDWSGYHTHWTPIEVPEPPNCGADMRPREEQDG